MFIFRLATRDDLRYLPALYFSAFGNTSTEEIFAFHYNLADRYILVALLDGVIVGYTHGYIEQVDEYAHVSVLAVEPLYHRQGIGRELLNNLLIIFFRNPRIRRVTLWVHNHNTNARWLYRSMGFVEILNTNPDDSDFMKMELGRGVWISSRGERE